MWYHERVMTAKPRIVIQFIVTAQEKRAIQRAAKRAGMTVSQWLRRYATVSGDTIYGQHGGTKLP